MYSSNWALAKLFEYETPLQVYGNLKSLVCMETTVTAVQTTYPSEVSEPPSLGCWEALSNGHSLYKYLKKRSDMTLFGDKTLLTPWKPQNTHLWSTQEEMIRQKRIRTVRIRDKLRLIENLTSFGSIFFFTLYASVYVNNGRRLGITWTLLLIYGLVTR